MMPMDILRLITEASIAKIQLPASPIIQVGTIYLLLFDGRSRGNLDPSGSGSVMVKITQSAHPSIMWYASMAYSQPTTTNNKAEYSGLEPCRISLSGLMRQAARQSHCSRTAVNYQCVRRPSCLRSRNATRHSYCLGSKPSVCLSSTRKRNGCCYLLFQDVGGRCHASSQEHLLARVEKSRVQPLHPHGLDYKCAISDLVSFFGYTTTKGSCPNFRQTRKLRAVQRSFRSGLRSSRLLDCQLW